ncbi:MAG TPA: hypothetical protein VJ770_24070 [Stellaceae bacterium]|nr:hypothetical protein [Stellaceae bacterium]
MPHALPSANPRAEAPPPTPRDFQSCGDPNGADHSGNRFLAIAATPLRCWRGELPLPVTYWVWGVGGNVAFALLLWRALAGAARDKREARRARQIYGVSLVWFVFVFGAIWRSAGRYQGPPLWALLARSGVSSGVLRMAVEFALVASV